MIGAFIIDAIQSGMNPTDVLNYTEKDARGLLIFGTAQADIMKRRDWIRRLRRTTP